MLRFVCSTLLFVLLLLSSMAQAGTFWVSQSGSNGNPCTNTTTPQSTGAKQTIAAGIACMVAAGGAPHTLYIRGGTYNECIDSDNQTMPTGTSYSNAITIASAPGETATLAPGSECGNVVALNTFNTNYHIRYIIFDRLVFNATNNFAAITALRNPTGFDCDHIRYQNIDFFRTSGQCTTSPGGNNPQLVTGNGRFIEILNSKIHGNVCSHGFYVFGEDWLIENNEVYDNKSHGIQIYLSSGSGVDRIIVRNNKIHDSGISGITVNSGTGSQIYNNVFYRNGGGIDIGMNTSNSNMQVYNNTVANNTGPGIQLGGSGSGSSNISPIVRNNIVFGNTSQIDDYGSISPTFGTNLCGSSGAGCSIIAPSGPGFVSAAGGDFHISAAGSPANNAGVNLTSVGITTDADGIGRPSSDNWTIGAYEFGGTCIPANCPTGQCCGNSCCPPNPDPDALIAHWPFDEGSGTTAVDAVSGNTHPCTLTSAGWQSPGIIGSSGFLLNGTRSCAVSNVTGLSPPAFSISSWMRGTVLPSAVSYLYSTGDSIQFYINSAGQVGWTVFTDTYHTITSSASVQNGVNHHLVATYSPANGQRLWIDGAQVALLSSSGLSLSYPAGTVTQIGRIGANDTLAYTGMMNQVRVYNYALQQGDVDNLFNELAPSAGTVQTHQQYATANAAQSDVNLITALDANHSMLLNTSVDLIVTLTRAGASTNKYYPLYCSVNAGTWTKLTQYLQLAWGAYWAE